MKEKVLIPDGWSKDLTQYWANNFVKYVWETGQRFTKEHFNELWKRQGGRCVGCQELLAHPERQNQRSIVMGVKPEVDHDHQTGFVRGLLCRSCNQFLGKIQDNRELLKRLLDYLGEKS